MKKIIASILSLAIVLGLFTSYTAIADSALTSDNETLLKLVGVTDENTDENKILTKGDFAQMLAKVAFELNADIKNYSGNVTLYDVPATNKYYDAFSSLYNRGYAVTDKYGCFYPERQLSAEDAYEMIMRTMGYSEKTIPEGTTFASLAMKKGIAKGVTFGESGEITAYNAYIMIANMLKCDITDLKYIKYDTSDNKLIYMTIRLGLYEISGVVTDDGNISMYGDSQISDGEIVVGGSDPMINKTGKDDLFGLNVLGYFVYDKAEREYWLIAAEKRESKNRITEILSKNITGYENRTYSYLSDEFSSSEKRIKVPKNAVVVYNNRTLRLEDDFRNDMFVPKNGIVKLYDNDGNGSVDIVRIEDYVTEIVLAADAKDETIYVKNERPLYDFSEKKYTIYDSNNNKISFSEIPADSVISIMEGLDKEHYKIIVSTYSQTETVTSIVRGSGDEKGYVMTSDGGKYVLSDYANQYYSKVEINTPYKFVFDMFDNVAGLTKDLEAISWQIGYLVWIRENDDANDEEYIAKIFDGDGEFYTYSLNKKVSVIKPDDTVDKYFARDVSGEINYSGIIRYKININDILTHIELPHTYGEKPKTDDRLFYLLDTVEKENKDNYYTSVQGQTVNFGGAVIITGNTEVFAVPSDKSEYEDYSVGNYSSFVSGNKYSLYAYGIDYKKKNAACICFSSSDSQGTAITNERPNTIVNVTYEFDEKRNQPMYKIDCCTNQGNNVTYYMEDEMYENEVFAIGAGNKEPIRMAPGDIVYMEVDGSSNLKKAVVAYDADQYVTDEKGNKIKGAIAGTDISYYSSTNTLCSPFAANGYTSGNPGSANSWMFNGGTVKIFSGWVYSYEDGYMLITNQNPAYGYDYNAARENGFLTEAVYYGSSIATTITNNGRGKVTVAKTTANDIKPYTTYGAKCSRVVLTKRVYDNRTISIINDN